MFIICEEGCLSRLFDPREKYETAKLFLEGQGLMTECKGRDPRPRWSGVPVIMTTNELPSVMREPKRKDDEEDYQYKERRNTYMAMRTRCKYTEINKSHKNNDRFPYNADQLALYM